MRLSRCFAFLFLLASCPMANWAQRITQTLDRGVVAVKNGNQVLVSWRKLAQEPEDATYNVYVDGRLVNAKPLSVSNFSTTTSVVPVGSNVAVSLVTRSRSGQSVEGELSRPFAFRAMPFNNMYLHLLFDGFLDNATHDTKFVWPADLDGDGDLEYVVDRLCNNDDKVEAYEADGTRLWTVALGPNVHIDTGQNDMVVAYDVDCDGKAEVVIKSSDGTRFWDKQAGSFGRYLFGSEDPDSDSDGIVDYSQQGLRNPPQYISVIDGETGAEKASVEMDYPSDGVDTYTRDNKANYLDEEYSLLNGHMGVCFLDGVHPSVGMEYMCRDKNKTHHYYVSAWGFFDVATGAKGDWREHFTWSRNDKSPWPAEFHHIKIADVNGDGRDEILGGGYGVNHKGEMEFSAGISHGDRIRISDIDPERPGLETFAIQQNAADMLGMILYDSGTGEALKKWYLTGVGDVGRGDCYDMDPATKGWEMFSTMNDYAVYDAQGNATGKSAYFPTEALWWDGDLGREHLNTPDGNGANAMIEKYGKGRIIEFAKESGWTVNSIFGKRALYWGDCIGDWREEVVLRLHSGDVCTGIVGYSTNLATSVDNIYCLQEDPAYSMQCTTKGYYQTAAPSFYLGYDMPRPPLPPVMRESSECQVFGVSLGNATVSPSTDMRDVYVMPVGGQSLTISNFSGSGDDFTLWKGLKGKLVLRAPLRSSGKVIVSEGELCASSVIDADVELRARGVLSGNPVVNGELTIEGALNYDEGKLQPNGTMTFSRALNVDARLFVDLREPSDRIVVKGDLSVSAPLVFSVGYSVEPGEYVLVDYEGSFRGEISHVSLRGLTGKACRVVLRPAEQGGALVLVVDAQRSPASGVVWTGAESDVWDYSSLNFSLDGQPVAFVAGDEVVFDDSAVRTDVVLSDLMPVGSVEFRNVSRPYSLSGAGGISGSGSVSFSGDAQVDLDVVRSDYSGRSVIYSGVVKIKELTDAGVACSLGSGSEVEVVSGSLVVDNSSTATNRAFVLSDSATICIPSGTCALCGLISGDGCLIKEGSGQLNITFSGNNTYSGGTELAAGTLAMGAWNTTFGVATSDIHVTGDATLSIFNNNSINAIPSFRNRLVVDRGKTLTLNGGSRCSVKPVLAGGGTIKISFPYVRGDFAPDAKAFEGVLDVVGGELRLAGVLDMPLGTLRLSGDGAVYNNAGSHKVGAIAGANPSASIQSGKWTVGSLGTDVSFAGSFSVPITKVGTGSLTLSGASTGAVSLSAGTLVTANSSAPVTTGLITVSDGALLSGSGQVQSVDVLKGGAVSACGTGIQTGSMVICGDLRVREGGILRARYSTYGSTSVDFFDVAGSVSLESPIFELKAILGSVLPDEALLQVFSPSTPIALSGSACGEPLLPKEGWLWDFSTLANDGIVRLKPQTTSLRDLISNGSGNSVLWDVAGRRVVSPCKGLFLNKVNNTKAATYLFLVK